jgi:GAF domain-containing protein
VGQKGLSDHYVRSGLTQPQKIVPILLRDGYFFSRDATTDPLLNNHEMKRAERIASILVVPAMIKGKLHGGLCVFTSSPRDFSEKDIEFLTALAEQGGMAIQHARLFEQVREYTRLFLDLSININSSLDIKKIFHILSADIAETLKVKASSILLVDEEKGTLELVASYGLSETYLNRGPLSAEKSVVESLEGKPVVIKNVAGDRRVRFKKEKQAEGIVSILSVPIKSKEKVIGVLRLYSGVQREFTEDEIMLVTALAYQGGLAIQNASMYLMLQNDMKDLKEDIWSHRSWF